MSTPAQPESAIDFPLQDLNRENERRSATTKYPDGMGAALQDARDRGLIREAEKGGMVSRRMQKAW